MMGNSRGGSQERSSSRSFEKGGGKMAHPIDAEIRKTRERRIRSFSVLIGMVLGILIFGMGLSIHGRIERSRSPLPEYMRPAVQGKEFLTELATASMGDLQWVRAERKRLSLSQISGIPEEQLKRMSPGRRKEIEWLCTPYLPAPLVGRRLYTAKLSDGSVVEATFMDGSDRVKYVRYLKNDEEIGAWSYEFCPLQFERLTNGMRAISGVPSVEGGTNLLREVTR